MEKKLPFKKPIAVLYEDEQYLVFDKPAGFLIIPSPKGEENTLTHIVNEQYAAGKDWKLHPCHRLDRDTSGVILYAKGKSAQQVMMDLFHQHQIQKKYVAFVNGNLKPPQGQWKGNIRSFDERKFQKNSKGQLAVTKYKVIEQKKKFSIVEIEPVTGRTNQIRIQFSEKGFPLVGERKYAFARDYPLKFRRVALHSSLVSWISHEIDRMPWLAVG